LPNWGYLYGLWLDSLSLSAGGTAERLSIILKLCKRLLLQTANLIRLFRRQKLLFLPLTFAKAFYCHPFYPAGNKTRTNFYSGVICQSQCSSRKIVIIGIKVVRRKHAYWLPKIVDTHPTRIIAQLMLLMSINPNIKI